MPIPSLIPVDSQRFKKAWGYDAQGCELYVRFLPSKKNPCGSLVAYANFDSLKWDEAQEQKSKGSWLGIEVINMPDLHPFRYVDEPPVDVGQAIQDGIKLGEDVRASISQQITGKEPTKNRQAETATIADMELVPEPIREVKSLPAPPKLAMPEILPAEIRPGEQGEKPFTQLVKERAAAIAAAVPLSLVIANAESYRALGAALVVIQQERRAVTDALEMIARPMIDAKRRYDEFRNQVLNDLQGAEKRLEAALGQFKRVDDARRKAEEDADRREREAKARREAEARAEQERQRLKQEADEMAKAAEQRRQEALQRIEAAEATKASQNATDSPQGIFGAGEGALAASVIEDAQSEIALADLELAESKALAETKVEVAPIYVPPVVHAKTDLKVAGMRAKPPKWRWQLNPNVFRTPVRPGDPISRTALRNPDLIAPEYWVLDENAINGLVRSMKDRVSIPGIEVYDENN